MKGIQIRNEEVKLLLFAEDVVLYIENLKDSTKVARTYRFIKFADCTINVQNKCVCIH